MALFSHSIGAALAVERVIISPEPRVHRKCFVRNTCTQVTTHKHHHTYSLYTITSLRNHFVLIIDRSHAQPRSRSCLCTEYLRTCVQYTYLVHILLPLGTSRRSEC